MNHSLCPGFGLINFLYFRYVISQFKKIKMSGSENAKSVAKLYDEMKRRDGQLLARMSERFPTLL